MHTLKYYYWIVDPRELTGITPKGLVDSTSTNAAAIVANRPTKEEIVSIRSYMLLFVKQVIMSMNDFKEDFLSKITKHFLSS